MTLWQRIEEASTGLITAGVAGVVSGALWVIRRVLTNQAQIEMLQREITHRDNLRKEDREALGEVRDSVKRIENVLLSERGK